MKIVLCINREYLYNLISSFLKDEIETFQPLQINNELFDHVYKINPDLIFFDPP